MNTFNPGSTFRTRKENGAIKAYSNVVVKNPLDYQTKCIVEDKNGNTAQYSAEDLMGFGIILRANLAFDIDEDLYDKKDEFGNEKCLKGYVHLTKNVRAGKELFRFWEDCKYTNIHPGIIHYEYDYNPNLKDEEIIEILLNEILYHEQPDLQSTSLVGTDRKGIDADPNYHDGHYFMTNHKEYTMTWCGGTVKIREGKDGGWYCGTKTPEKTIYEGQIDWQKYKMAKIRKYALRKLQMGKFLFEEFPSIEYILVDSLKDNEKFKLSSEF